MLNREVVRMKKGEERTAYLFLLPSLLGTVVFVLLPFMDVIRRSFTLAVGGVFTGLDNYREVLANTAFRQALLHTVKFLAVCLPLLLALSFGTAVLVSKAGRGRKLLETVFLLPMAIPVASVVVFWRILFHDQGLLNEVLACFHLEGRDWMNSGAAFPVLVFSYIWKNLGYDMVLWSAGLSGIPKEQYEAARVSGAGGVQCFWYITLPQMRSTAVMTGVLSFVNAFRVFREAYLIAGEYPHDSIYMLQHLFNNWFTKLDIEKMSAAAVLLAAGMSGLLLLIEWWNSKEERDG